MKRKIDENHPLSYFLKSAREDMDLTQLDVMRLTGINNKTLSGYENGVAEPDFKSPATLSKLYNISFDELLCISSENTAKRPGLSKNEEKLLSLFRRLVTNDQKSRTGPSCPAFFGFIMLNEPLSFLTWQGYLRHVHLYLYISSLPTFPLIYPVLNSTNRDWAQEHFLQDSYPAHVAS